MATGLPWHGILDAMSARTTSRVLVGRETELGQLREVFRRARRDEPATVLVGGEAGVGKTRLVEEFGRYAVAEGGRVFVGQCLELGEDGLAFAPFAAILRDLLRRDGPAAFAGYERELARLLPELAQSPQPARPDQSSQQSQPTQQPALPGGPVQPASAEAPATGKNRGHLFEAVSALVEGLAAEQPLVLVVEDLHWADRSTRDLIRFLVRSVRATRSVLIGTFRSDELHRGHPLRAFLAELDRIRSVERLDLDRLDRDGTAQILGHLLGHEPPASLVDSVHARAQGNPFFVEELATCADRPGGGLPDNVRDLLLARVDQLPEAAQRVLRIAAAGGNPIGHRLLAEVAGVPDVELEEALRAAVAAQLLLPDADGEAYEFRHALVREAVHDDLLPGQHTRLHAAYAAAIEARPELVGVERAPSEIAHHWYNAHDHPRALTAAVRAAESAGQRYAYAEQSRLLDRVLALWDQVPDAELRAGPYLDVLVAAMEAATGTGDHARALSLVRAALGEIDERAAPLRAAQLLVSQSKLLVRLGRSDGLDPVRRAYELSKLVDDGAQRSALLADVAFQIGQADRQEGARIAAEAAELARQAGDPAAEVRAKITAAHTSAKMISAEEGLAELRGAERIVLVTGDTPSLLRLLVNKSDLLFEVGEYAESARLAEQGIADARRLGVGRTMGAYLLGNLAEALVALGRFDEAEARCAEAARFDPPATLALLWLVHRARVRLARGHPGAGAAVSRAVGFLSLPFLRPSTRLPLLELRISAALAAGTVTAAGMVTAGTAAEAASIARAAGTDTAAETATVVAVAADAVAEARRAQEPRYAWPVLAAAARAAVTADDLRLRELVLAATGTLTARYPAERAYAKQVAAELAPPSFTAWGEAVEAWRADGQPYPLACALVRLAEAAAAAGDRATAARAITEATALATGLGATPLVEKARVLTRRLGLRAAEGTSAAGTCPLTPRELEVLRLVSAGLSNRRIAEELFISPKTASVHVSRIIAKLAVANRVEAAAVARRLGLLDD